MSCYILCINSTDEYQVYCSEQNNIRRMFREQTHSARNAFLCIILMVLCEQSTE